MVYRLSQEDLPLLSNQYSDFADSVAKRVLIRDHLWIGDVEKDETSGLIDIVLPQPGKKPMHDLGLLIKLSDIGSYRAEKPEISKRNTATVARIGGMATREVYAKARRQNVHFPIEEMEVLHQTLGVIHEGLYDVFKTIFRPRRGDRVALEILTAAGRTLGKEQ